MIGRPFRRIDLPPIIAGGVLGATARWAAGRATTNGFPTTTLVVNLAGCMLLGALTVRLAQPTTPNRRRVLVGLATGFCGSLTTMSGFAVEAAELLGWGTGRADRVTAVAYVAITVIGAGVSFALGRLAIRRLAP